MLASPTWNSLVASAARTGVRLAWTKPAAGASPTAAAFVPACTTVEHLVRFNKEGSRCFTDEPAYSSRRRYIAKHPTQVVMFKCMDGRLNVTTMTQMPVGILTPFRNIGGRFDLGWPLLKEAVKNLAHFAEGRGSRTLVMSSYHYSKGDVCRGCKGMNFDKPASIAEATRFHDQLLFGFSPMPTASVVPLVVGIETDDESLVLHGEKDGVLTGDILNIADFAAPGAQLDEAALAEAVKQLFPTLDRPLLRDLLPLLYGNARHVDFVRREHAEGRRTIIDYDHREIVIGVGRGFDWLHVPNKALLIGPFEHNWVDHAVTAAKVILGNIKDRKSVAPEEGAVILSSALCYAPPGSAAWNMATEQSLYLAKTSMEAVAKEVPELLQATHLHVMPVVVSGDTLLNYPVLPSAMSL